MFPSSELSKHFTIISLIIFPIVYYKGLLMILRKYRGMKEKEKKKEADLGIMGSSMEEIVANLGNWSFAFYFIFWASSTNGFLF